VRCCYIAGHAGKPPAQFDGGVIWVTALRKLKLTRLQPRPFHPKRDEAAQEAFKKPARIGAPPVAVETGCAILS
jgi:Winged helix-turn helix